MRAFHIDLNTANPTRRYLEAWLRELAALGYDTVVWEVENAVAWEAIAGCEAPAAFAKDEFAGIVAYGRSLGLEPIPLLQTLGHCEYVLTADRFAHLREQPDRIDQYCPSHPEVPALMAALIDEYLAVFGPVRRFHLGLDETGLLARCPRCAGRTPARIWSEHLRRIAAPLAARGIDAMAWADMAMAHPEALGELPPGLVLCDWYYRGRRDPDGLVPIWDHDFGGPRGVAPDALPSVFTERYREWLSPDGGAPDPFYTARWLRSRGLRVVGCSATSSFPDNVFAPCTARHLANTWDWCTVAIEQRLEGVLVTSWTVHLFPWELQRPVIAAGGAFAAHGAGGREAFRAAYPEERFGPGCGGFWAACEELAEPFLFSHTQGSGLYKGQLGTPAAGYVAERIERLSDVEATTELARAESCRAAYARGRSAFAGLSSRAVRGHDELEWWDWAARNLEHRADAIIHLLRRRLGRETGPASALASRCAELRDESDARLADAQKAPRRALVLDRLYASLAHALGSAAAAAPG